MAIRPIKSLSDLGVPTPNRYFKNGREISQKQIFTNLLITGLEHLIVYCHGNNLDDFFNNTLSFIPQAQSPTFRSTHSESLSDLDSLFEKKQLKILNSLIYDPEFLNVAEALQESFDVPESKTSENEYLHALEYYAKKMKINVLVLRFKQKEISIQVKDPFVHINLYQGKGLCIIYPFEYMATGVQNLKNIKGEEEEDMRKNNFIEIHNSDEETMSASIFGERFSMDSPVLIRKSLGRVQSKEDIGRLREIEVEKRMRHRSKVMKANRKNAELKKSMEVQGKNSERPSIDKPENSVFRNFSYEEFSSISKISDSRTTSLLNSVQKPNRESFNIEYEDFRETEKQRQIEEWLKKREQEREKYKSLTLSKDLDRIKQQDQVRAEFKKREEERTREDNRISEETKILEEKRREIEKKIFEKRKQADEKRKEEERKLAEQRKILEESRQSISKKLIEERNLAEKIAREQRIVESQKLIDGKGLAEEKRILAEEKLNEARRNLENKGIEKAAERINDSKKVENERKINEKRRIEEKIREEEEKRYIEAQRILEEKKAVKEKKLMEEKRIVEEKKIADDKRIQEQRKVIEELRKSEEGRIAKEKEKSDELKAAERKKKLLEAQKRMENERIEALKKLEEKKLEEEKKAQEAKIREQQKIAELIRLEEQKKLEVQNANEQKRLEEQKAIEHKKLEAQKLNEKKRLEEQKTKQLEIQKQQKQKEELAELIRKEEQKKAEEQAILKKKEQDLKEAELKKQELNKAELKKQEEQKLAEKRKQDEAHIIEEKKKKLEEDKKRVEEQKQQKKEEDPYTETDNTTYCGGLYCIKCSKELKRSNYFLKCETCNDKFLKSNSLSTVQTGVKVPANRNCLNCHTKITKGEEVHCIRCFLQIKIFGENPSQCTGCIRNDKCYWIDANEGEKKFLSRCGFCDEMKNKDVILSICSTCDDHICLICLRKNPYVAQAICSHCHNRRQPALI